MGHKVHPVGMRLGLTENWRSRWYADKKSFANFLVEDAKIREFIKSRHSYAGIPTVEIERTREMVKVILGAARAGVIIGRKGGEKERLRDDLERLTGRVVVVEVRDLLDAKLRAQIIAESIAEQLVKRSPVRRTIRRAAETAMQDGARGIKIVISGRIGGSEMSRHERLVLGSIPLQTLKADIDYGFAEARTTAGQIGIKVWVYKGMIETSEEHSNGSDAKESQVSKVSKR